MENGSDVKALELWHHEEESISIATYLPLSYKVYSVSLDNDSNDLMCEFLGRQWKETSLSYCSR